MTLGWAVVLRKLRQFQEAGHVAVLIVGDFTARVGDPSGRAETRPRLSKDEVQGHADRLLDQFWKVLDPERTEVRYNAEWLEPMDTEAILRLTASTTVARMLERDDFAKRYAQGKPISIMEFLYPLLQGMDSVAVEADVELGGRDQTFNLLVGRDLQREYGQEPQVALTTPLLVGTDGVQKMSQSVGNYIGITDPPDEMFGKLVRVPDELIATYRLLALDFFRDPAEADGWRRVSRTARSTPGRRSAGSRARSWTCTTATVPVKRRRPGSIRSTETMSCPTTFPNMRSRRTSFATAPFTYRSSCSRSASRIRTRRRAG